MNARTVAQWVRQVWHATRCRRYEWMDQWYEAAVAQARAQAEQQALLDMPCSRTLH